MYSPLAPPPCSATFVRILMRYREPLSLVVLALLVGLPLLSLALAYTGMGRIVPLAVIHPAVDAVPAGHGGHGGVHAAAPAPLATWRGGQLLTSLAGQAMAPRLLGAWLSTALLLGLKLGLALARFGPAYAEGARGRQRSLELPTRPAQLAPAQGLDWAGLLRMTFAVDVFACVRCGGRR